ncbi:LutC/YkgG family protein [Nocardioides flavescens]|uniref:Lactate utilization protein C n=1 Tax=Nocardioides flavescens TaxID=2691959 RepID=A0A6L7F0K3_9ACTN|nr:LUD domain-containing protein [Nocardioides flavescens]MXG88334.1 lactate utilization protein C [Nocardioides flavescens]
MNDARTAILERVRGALHGTERAAAPVPRDYRTNPARRPVRPDLLDLFVERVEDYRARVHRCTPAEVADTLATVLRRRRTVVPDGFAWPVPQPVPGAGLTAAELDRIPAVVTTATLGVATTGTLVLTHGEGQGPRAFSLVPDVHVCVLPADRVVLGVPEAVAALDPHRPQTWISGPSATSDIELDRVEGVHGPRELHVLVVT